MSGNPIKDINIDFLDFRDWYTINTKFSQIFMLSIDCRETMESVKNVNRRLAHKNINKRYFKSTLMMNRRDSCNGYLEAIGVSRGRFHY